MSDINKILMGVEDTPIYRRQPCINSVGAFHISSHQNFILLISCYFLVGCVATSPFYRYETRIEGLTKPPSLQVLLSKHHQVDSVRVCIQDGFNIYAYHPSRLAQFTSTHLLSPGHPLNNAEIKTTLNGLVIGDINLNGYYDVVMVPLREDSLIIVGQRPYRGRLRAKAMAYNKISLINIIDLETYLYGVVGSEADPGWPIETLSAQAIAARTYALYRIKQERSKGRQKDFDLTDDIFSQVYSGFERTNQKICQAVDFTRGVILIYQGEIISSFYHNTCGGHTEPAYLIFGVDDIPPLQGTVCGFCTQSKYHYWETVISSKEIIGKLNLQDITSIESIEIVQSAPGGHTTLLKIKTSGRTDPILIDAQKFRIALGPNRLRSTLFKIRRINSTRDALENPNSRESDWEFVGQGWGHGVGMCQNGTLGMAQQGFLPLQILEYYYPQIKVVKLLY